MVSHWPDAKLLQARLAPSTARAYASEIAAYERFCQVVSAAPGQAESLARWRAHLMAQGTRPQTVNRKLAAVKHLVRAGADAGEVDAATAQAFTAVSGMPPAGAEPQPCQVLTAAVLRQLCDAPDPSTLVGCRDRALLAMLVAGAAPAQGIDLAPVEAGIGAEAEIADASGELRDGLRRDGRVARPLDVRSAEVLLAGEQRDPRLAEDVHELLRWWWRGRR